MLLSISTAGCHMQMIFLKMWYQILCHNSLKHFWEEIKVRYWPVAADIWVKRSLEMWWYQSSLEVPGNEFPMIVVLVNRRPAQWWMQTPKIAAWCHGHRSQLSTRNISDYSVSRFVLAGITSFIVGNDRVVLVVVSLMAVLLTLNCACVIGCSRLLLFLSNFLSLCTWIIFRWLEWWSTFIAHCSSGTILCESIAFRVEASDTKCISWRSIRLESL